MKKKKKRVEQEKRRRRIMQKRINDIQNVFFRSYENICIILYYTVFNVIFIRPMIEKDIGGRKRIMKLGIFCTD